MDKLDDINKSMYEIKIKDGLTLCYKESVSGGLFGFIKEKSSAISEGKDLDELIVMVLKAKEDIERVEGIERSE